MDNTNKDFYAGCGMFAGVLLFALGLSYGFISVAEGDKLTGMIVVSLATSFFIYTASYFGYRLFYISEKRDKDIHDYLNETFNVSREEQLRYPVSAEILSKHNYLTKYKDATFYFLVAIGEQHFVIKTTKFEHELRNVGDRIELNDKLVYTIKE